MARSNRPRGRKPAGSDEPDDGLSRLMAGWRRTESGRDGLWTVQPVSGAQAVKAYTCPGCSLQIAPGLAHVVAWRNDGLMGEAADLAARRHWHTHCWKIR